MSEDGFKEVTGATGFQFSEPNDQIEGELIAVEPGQYGNNYVIKTDSGERMTVLGSTVINTKMADVEVGKTVRITYLGEQKSSTTGRVYKDFKVEVK